MEEPEINPVEYSKWAFKIMVGFVGVICLMVFTPLSGHLSNLFANTPVPNTTLIATLQSFQCGQSTVQDADANTYNTIAIGTQCWMASNLNVGTRINIASNQTDNAVIEKWCYSDTDANCDTTNNPNQPDGGLYQWDEMMQYSTTEGAQGICPTGWHIPTHDEFTTMERAICTSGSCATDFPYDTTTTGYRGTNEGTKLKPNGSSGLEFNLAGVGFGGSFFLRGTNGSFWSSSESGSIAWSRNVDSGSAQVGRSTGDQSGGLSVRCLKDDPRTTGTVTIASTPPSTELDSGLVGHWTFDGEKTRWQDTTSEIKDSSGNANDGNAQGGLGVNSPVIGNLGQALNFNGTSDYVSVGSVGTIKTISFWLKTSDTTSRKIIDLNGTAQVELDGSSQVTGTGWSSPTYYVDGAAGGRTVTGGDWHHVVITTGTGINASAVDLGRVSTGYYEGALDDIRLYDRTLTASDVARLYPFGKATIVPPVCSSDTVEDADANTYNTIAIGTQCWMASNLNVGTRINIASNQTDNAVIEKWCYSDTDANCDTTNNPNQPDGGLYQWDEAMQYSTTEGAQGICPTGWHIPTHDEYTTMERAICTSGSCATDFPYDTTTTGYRGTNEGTKLKPNGSTGLEFNLAGLGNSGSFFNRGSFGYFWSSSESGTKAWYRLVSSGSAQVSRRTNVQSFGFSVRCVED